MAQEKWLVEGPKTIDVERVRSLKLGLVAGSVDVVAHDEPSARIEVHSVHGRPLRIQIDGDALEIDHVQIGWDNWIDVFKQFKDRYRADISIAVPRDVALKFGVVSASGLVSGIHEDASISTVSGDLVIDGMSGDLSVNGVSGELAVRDHYGKVSARTVSGDVAVTGEVFDFSCESVSGDVFLDFSGIPDAARINSVSGDVTLRLDRETPTSYTINTVSGRLQLDDDEIRGVRGRYTGRYRELDGRWVDFKANTVSGDVRVLHAVRA
jgi:hypothetical protein